MSSDLPDAALVATFANNAEMPQLVVLVNIPPEDQSAPRPKPDPRDNPYYEHGGASYHASIFASYAGGGSYAELQPHHQNVEYLHSRDFPRLRRSPISPSDFLP